MNRGYFDHSIKSTKNLNYYNMRDSLKSMTSFHSIIMIINLLLLVKELSFPMVK